VVQKQTHTIRSCTVVSDGEQARIRFYSISFIFYQKHNKWSLQITSCLFKIFIRADRVINVI